jgi:hypothetical protein
VNDSTPLPALSHDVAQWPRRYQKVDFLLGSGTAENNGANGYFAAALGAAERWRNDLSPFDPAVLDLDLSDLEPRNRPAGLFARLRQGSSDHAGAVNSDDFLWLWSRNAVDAKDRSCRAWHLPATFSKWVLRAAVLANGGTLVALAFMIQSMPMSAGRAAAVVLGLGLLFAALSTVLAYLNFQLAGLRLPNASHLAASFWLAAISCAGSYAALAMAAFCVWR